MQNLIRLPQEKFEVQLVERSSSSRAHCEKKSEFFRKNVIKVSVDRQAVWIVSSQNVTASSMLWNSIRSLLNKNFKLVIAENLSIFIERYNILERFYFGWSFKKTQPSHLHYCNRNFMSSLILEYFISNFTCNVFRILNYKNAWKDLFLHF